MTNDKLRIIGLTGPIGSGKTEAAKILKRIGAHIIEADKIGHELFKSKLERKKAAGIVFSCPEKLKELNKISHPYIKKRIKEEMEKSSKLRVKGCGLIVVDAALPELFKGLVHEVWLVISPKQQRIDRLLAKSLELSEIKKRIQSQMGEAGYRKIADKIIMNNGTIKDLNEKIQACLKF